MQGHTLRGAHTHYGGQERKQSEGSSPEVLKFGAFKAI